MIRRFAVFFFGFFFVFSFCSVDAVFLKHWRYSVWIIEWRAHTHSNARTISSRLFRYFELCVCTFYRLRNTYKCDEIHKIIIKALSVKQFDKNVCAVEVQVPEELVKSNLFWGWHFLSFRCYLSSLYVFILFDCIHIDMSCSPSVFVEKLSYWMTMFVACA